jgi:hypothetical protein
MRLTKLLAAAAFVAAIFGAQAGPTVQPVEPYVRNLLIYMVGGTEPLYPNINGFILACRHPANHGNPIFVKIVEDNIVGYSFSCAGSAFPEPVVFNIQTGPTGQPVLLAVYSPAGKDNIFHNLLSLWVSALCYDRPCPDVSPEFKFTQRKVTHDVSAPPAEPAVYDLPIIKPNIKDGTGVKLTYDVSDMMIACRHPANNGTPSFTKQNYFKGGKIYYVFQCAGSSHPDPIILSTSDEPKALLKDKSLFLITVAKVTLEPTMENFANYLSEIQLRVLCYDQPCQNN